MTARHAAAALILTLTAASPALAQFTAGPFVNPANGHRYARTNPATWTAGSQLARQLGGTLVTINDAAENQWVHDTVLRAGGSVSGCYIGLNDALVEGTFVWESGEAVTYTNWEGGSPSTSNGDVADAIGMIATIGTWNPIFGSFNFPSIIEFSGPIRVPQEFPTIQAAIDAALDGQTILVAPGNYVGTFDFGYKKLVIRSTHGPAVTTITGNSTTASVVMAGGQGPETQLEGFTVRTSAYCNELIALFDGQVVRNCSFPRTFAGTAVFIGGSGVLDSCVIAGMQGVGFTRSGVLVQPFYRNIAPTIQNCTIVDSGWGLYLGGGNIFPETRINLINSIVRENSLGQCSVPSTLGTLSAKSCNIGATTPGTGNINADPRFVSAPGPDGFWGTDDDDFRLQPGSPCIDAGSNAARISLAATGFPFDVYAGGRYVNDPATADTGVGPGPVIDIGAAEFQGAGGSTTACSVDFNHDGNIDPDDLGDFITAFFGGCP